jgi:hypothetical protein
MDKPLFGVDTPTLLGVWETPPYLHDGSAATLRDVLTTKNPDDLHGYVSALSSQELDELVAYLQQIDDGQPVRRLPFEPELPTAPGGAGGAGAGGGAAGGSGGASSEPGGGSSTGAPAGGGGGVVASGGQPVAAATPASPGSSCTLSGPPRMAAGARGATGFAAALAGLSVVALACARRRRQPRAERGASKGRRS